MVEKSGVENSGVEKFMVEKSGVEKFMVEKSGVEMSCNQKIKLKLHRISGSAHIFAKKRIPNPQVHEFKTEKKSLFIYFFK